MLNNILFLRKDVRGIFTGCCYACKVAHGENKLGTAHRTLLIVFQQSFTNDK